MHVQGKLVVGEATADLGGITLAYRAFHRSKEYKKAKTIDGMTPDQQFFLGTAHVWATNIRPEQIRNQVTTDPHPPAQYRVNGSLANIPQFQQHLVFQQSPMVNVKIDVLFGRQTGSTKRNLMCRFVAYLGRPTFLENVLVNPKNSIVMQSLHARETNLRTNGDGFGVGWYAPEIST